jgi:type II secretory pathway pseudopilin PulG
MVAALIGITVPERLRQRQFAVDAARSARLHTIARALLDYRDSHGTFPTDLEALRSLSDPDGSIAEALRDLGDLYQRASRTENQLELLDSKGYRATTALASANPKSKPMVTRGVALRDARTPSAPEPASYPFTSYTLTLPGERGWFSSDEELIMQDG